MCPGNQVEGGMSKSRVPATPLRRSLISVSQTGLKEKVPHEDNTHQGQDKEANRGEKGHPACVTPDKPSMSGRLSLHEPNCLEAISRDGFVRRRLERTMQHNSAILGGSRPKRLMGVTLLTGTYGWGGGDRKGLSLGGVWGRKVGEVGREKPIE